MDEPKPKSGSADNVFIVSGNTQVCTLTHQATGNQFTINIGDDIMSDLTLVHYATLLHTMNTYTIKTLYITLPIPNNVVLLLLRLFPDVWVDGPWLQQIHETSGNKLLKTSQ